MDVLLLLLLTAIILIHTWPKEGALIIVRYRNVAINNKGRLPPHPRPEKKSFFSIGTSENRIKSAISVTRKRNYRHEAICFLFIEQEKQIRWNMMDLLSHWNNHFLWVVGVSVLTKGQWNFQHLLEVLSDNKILLAFNIKPICWYMIHVHAYDNSRARLQNMSI